MQDTDDPVMPPVGRPAAVRLRNVPLPEPHLLGIVAGVGLQRLRPGTLPGSRYVHRLVGCSLIAAGTCLVVRSLAAAGSLDLEHPDRLVTTGPYALSRNPMYIGWVLLHLGSGLTGGSAWILATLPGVAASVHRQVLREERELAEKFGDEYGHYRATAPRYLPGWRRNAWLPGVRGRGCRWSNGDGHACRC